MISIEKLYKYYRTSRLVSTDTRTVQPASIFFALKGPNFNGNEFAHIALEKGAAFCVVDEEKFVKDERYLLTENSLKALQDLANYHRRQLKIPFLAITGSNGKTTTKELTRAVLGMKFRTHATSGNLNNHIGVPLTILSISEAIEFAVIEMGANHIGEIGALCHIAEPDYALITNVGRAHLEGFGSFTGVKKGKGELYQWVANNGKSIFMNGDNQHLGEMAAGIDPRMIVRYGTNAAFETFGLLKRTQPFLEVTWKSRDQMGDIRTNLIGEYNFENILAAIAIGNHFGVEAHLINSAIAAFVPENSRSQQIRIGTNTVILDAYNANPSSMEAALRNFSALPDPEKVICIGDMAELGEDTEREHKHILEIARSIPHSKLILVGKFFKEISSGIDCLPFENSKQAADYIKSHPFSSKTILIKGSRSTKMEAILDAL